MKPLTFERIIEATPTEVWSIMTDIEGYVSRFEKVDAVDLLTEGQFGVGTRWRETRTVYGRSATVESAVIECLAPERYTAEAHVGARAITILEFTPNGAGTRTSVRLTFHTVGGGLSYRLMEYLYRRRIRRCVIENNTQDLADLARACET